jgi:hypothetical protein
MNEFFDQLPQGPIRLSKRLIGRMGRELSGLSQFPPPPSFPGNAGNDSCGPWVDPQFDPIIFAKITAVPTGGYFGYSWLEQQPGPDGGNWYTPKPALQGDNGTEAMPIGPIDLATLNVVSGVATFETTTDHGFSADQLVVVAVDDDVPHSGTFRITGVPSDTSFTVDMSVGDVGMSISGTATVAARPAKMAAFPATGSDQLAVGDLVIILRGYLNGSGNDQQWIAIPFKAGGFRRVRPTGAGVSQESKLYYPSKLDLYDKPTKAFVDGETVWLLSRQGAALSEDGTGIYHSILEDPAFDVGGTVRPLWVTRDRPYLTDVECIAGVLVKTSDGPVTVPTTAQMRYVGKWDEDTTYKRGDVVLWASTYVAVVGSVPAGNPPPDPTYWEPLTLDFVSADQQKEVHANVIPDDATSGVIADNVLAIAAALARGIKQVHFPLGKINISTPITMTPAHSGTHLKGAGMGERINWFQPSQRRYVADDRGRAADQLQHWRLRLRGRSTDRLPRYVRQNGHDSHLGVRVHRPLQGWRIRLLGPPQHDSEPRHRPTNGQDRLGHARRSERRGCHIRDRPAADGDYDERRRAGHRQHQVGGRQLSRRLDRGRHSHPRHSRLRRGFYRRHEGGFE